MSGEKQEASYIEGRLKNIKEELASDALDRVSKAVQESEERIDINITNVCSQLAERLESQLQSLEGKVTANLKGEIASGIQKSESKTDNRVTTEINRFEDKLEKFISLFRWSSGLLVSLILAIVGLGWMIIQDRAPADSKLKIDKLSVHSCRAFVHGVDARQKLLADELQKLEDDRQQLDQQIDNIPNHTAYLSSAISGLENTVGEQKEAVTSIQSQLGSVEGAPRRYTLENELETVQDQYNLNAQELRRLREELRQLPQYQQNLESRRTNIEATLRARRTENKNLEKESSDCRGMIGRP